MRDDVKKQAAFTFDMYEPTVCLSLEQKGWLWDAVFLYLAGKEIDIPDPLPAMAFAYIRQWIDEEAAKQARLRLNGSKGGRPRKAPPRANLQQDENALSGNQEKPKGF